MPHRSFELFGISIIALTAVLAAAMAFDRDLFADAGANGAYYVLKDWQTLIGSLLALLAAFLALRPIYLQLNELRRQNEFAALTIKKNIVGQLERQRGDVISIDQSLGQLLSHLAKIARDDTDEVPTWAGSVVLFLETTCHNRRLLADREPLRSEWRELIDQIEIGVRRWRSFQEAPGRLPDNYGPYEMIYYEADNAAEELSIARGTNRSVREKLDVMIAAAWKAISDRELQLIS